MMKNFLTDKYGEFVTEKFLTNRNEVIRENFNKDGVSEQNEVRKHLKSLKDDNGNPLIPNNFWNNNVDWGFDFSSWIGEVNSKEFFLIGAEPHIENNYQLVYNFGNLKNKSIQESAIEHYNRESDIWHSLTKNFVTNLTEENITDFLEKCYITDLCHVVPKYCGQVSSICEKLSISMNEWNQFRASVARRFILREIQTVNPKYVILHGNASRIFFQNEFKVMDYHVYRVEDSQYTIQTWNLNGHEVISIPHLSGDMKNKLWKCKKHPNRPNSAKRILSKLTKNNVC